MAKPQDFKKNDPRINRDGAPKKEWTMKGLITEALEECDASGVPYKKIIARKLRTLASKGNIIAIKEINNRLDGMPPQDVTSKGEKLESPKVIIETKDN